MWENCEKSNLLLQFKSQKTANPKFYIFFFLPLLQHVVQHSSS